MTSVDPLCAPPRKREPGERAWPLEAAQMQSFVLCVMQTKTRNTTFSLHPKLKKEAHRPLPAFFSLSVDPTRMPSSAPAPSFPRLFFVMRSAYLAQFPSSSLTHRGIHPGMHSTRPSVRPSSMTTSSTFTRSPPWTSPTDSSPNVSLDTLHVSTMMRYKPGTSFFALVRRPLLPLGLTHDTRTCAG